MLSGVDVCSVSEALREGPTNPGIDPLRRAGAKGVSLPGTLPEAFGRYAWDEEVGPELFAEYSWNEENRMILADLDGVQVRYRYDHAGLRTAKQSSQFGETLYPDRLYQEQYGSGEPTATKHIFVGQTRIASKVHIEGQNQSNRIEYMRQNSFTYHADHLGSTNWVTDYEGNAYEYFAYTPYGESWVVEDLNQQSTTMTHRFTGQELDQETGLYAFPARYYDPQTSRWLGADPAMGEYLPAIGQSPSDLAGIGGVFASLNLAMYNYASNNPLGYVDPSGRERELSEIQADIANLQDEYGTYFYSPGYDTQHAQTEMSRLQTEILNLYGEYNRAVVAAGGLTIGDYIQDGRLTSGFGEFENLTGDYRTNQHAGVDGVGGYAKTPFYTRLAGVDSGRSNALTLKIIGTDLTLKILHGDAGTYNTRAGGLYAPGLSIMPFPRLNNSPASSTAPHFDFRISDGTTMVNPFTMRPDNSEFLFSLDGGRTWYPVSPF